MCRTNSTGRHAQPGARHWHVLTEGMPWKHPGNETTLSVAPAVARLLQRGRQRNTNLEMMKNDPNEHTGASSETCF